MQIHSIPYLLRLNDEGLTGQALYQFLFQRIRRAVDNQVDGDGEDLESLVLPSNPPRDAKMEQNHFAGEVPHYGFRLRYVSNDGLRCVQSHWLNRSIGRFIPADDTPLNLVDGATVAIDWHFSVIKVWPRLGRQPAVQLSVPAVVLTYPLLLFTRQNCFDPAAMEPVPHPSANPSATLNDQPLTLEKCIDTFIQEENIPEVAGCI